MFEDPRADSVADVFIKVIYKKGFKVKYDDIPSDAKGYCDFDNNTIVVKKNLNNLMRLKVIVHEYAHSLAHKYLKDNHKECTEHREQYESKAESIAYVVLKYLGLDNKTKEELLNGIFNIFDNNNELVLEPTNDIFKYKEENINI